MNIDSAPQLGREIRSTRKHLALTQSQLALAAGVGVRFIVDVEAGKPSVRFDTLLRVIHTLGGQLAVNHLSEKADDSQ
jgi:HTH-type transcriptional regulator / antitoxin HipB